MSRLLRQLAQLFDIRQQSYNLDDIQNALLTTINEQHGPLHLAIRTLEDKALVIEVLNIAILGEEHIAALSALTWQFASIGLARNPDDGEIRARLVLPCNDNVDAIILDNAFELLLPVADALRPTLEELSKGTLKIRELLNREGVPKALHPTFDKLFSLINRRDRKSLEKQFELCSILLEQVVKKDSPLTWANLQGTLGDVNSALLELTGKHEYGYDAERAYEQTLTVYGINTNPEQWAKAQHMLGSLNLTRYENSGNEVYERNAVNAYEQALKVYTRDEYPLIWGSIQHDLGLLSSRRYENSGDEEDAEQGKRGYERALTVRTQANVPVLWARTQHNLANLQSKRYKNTMKEIYARQAQRAYSHTLNVYTKESYPSEWASVQHNLGVLFDLRYANEEDIQYFQQAEDAYECALTVRTEEQTPVEWAGTQVAVGNLNCTRFQRDGNSTYAHQAAGRYTDALRIFTPLSMPYYAYGTAMSLATLQMHSADWLDAQDIFAIALKAAHNQYLTAIDEREQLRWMNKHSVLYRGDAMCLLKMGQLEQAWERLAEGRTRALTKNISLDAKARELHGEAAARKLQRLQRTARRHSIQAQHDRRTVVQEEATKAFERLESFIHKLHLETAVPPISEISLPEDVVAITVLLGDESYALLLRHGRIESVKLPNLPLSSLYKMIGYLPAEFDVWRSSLTKPDPDLSAWQSIMSSIVENQSNYEAGWFFAYQFAFPPPYMSTRSDATRATRTAWYATVERTLEQLREWLWVPLTEQLRGVEQLLFVPAGALALLPVHAAAPEGVAVAVVPSLGVWQQCRQRVEASTEADTETHTENRDLFLATPANDLPFTAAEAEWLRRRAADLGRGVTWLPRARASASAVAEEAGGKGIIHFSGHGSYNFADPLASALWCWDEGQKRNDPLRIDAIRNEMDLRRARLVTLSACSTGMSDVFDSGEEFVGLPGALVEVGAPAVVASLWPVHDISTAFLMDRFYERWLSGDGTSIAAALAEAAQWLRGATKADLIRRIEQSSASPQTKAGIQTLLEALLRVQSVRMAEEVGSTVAQEIASKADERPFAMPYYWAAFAAFGAVL